jgi:hypothetical protein
VCFDARPRRKRVAEEQYAQAAQSVPSRQQFARLDVPQLTP